MHRSTTREGKKMKRFLVTPLLLLMSLSVGCASLNHSFNSYTFVPGTPVPPAEPAEPVKIAHTVTESTDDKDDNYKCRPFRYELTGQGPELPEAKILEAGEDIRKVEAIERQHIKELRTHILKMRRRLRDAMLEHELECRKAAAL